MQTTVLDNSEMGSQVAKRPIYRLSTWIWPACIVIVFLALFIWDGLFARSASASQASDLSQPSEAEALLDLVDDQVTGLRGLEFQYPATLRVMTRAEFQAKLAADDEAHEASADGALTLAALELLEPQADLYQLMENFYSERIVGYYDKQEKTLYLISDQTQLGPEERLTLAHELTHALQDQHFDLASHQNAYAGDSEAAFAFKALVEGDASLVEFKYKDSHLTPQERVTLLLGWQLGTAEGAVDQTPGVIQETAMFPYREGFNFVIYLYQQGGWPAVDAAYARPPLSTEQILHPERYQAGDAPFIVSLPPLTSTLGPGWRPVDDDVLGEFYLRLHLQQQLTGTLAIRAAEGWGGDRYAVYRREADGASLLLLHTVWDTPAEALEFREAYHLYLDTATGQPASLAETEWRCWQTTAEQRCLAWWRNEVVVIRAPAETTVDQIVATFLILSAQYRSPG